jgi:hypothetical protein
MIKATYTIFALLLATLLIGATVVVAVSAELRILKKSKVTVHMKREKGSPPKHAEPEKPVITIGKTPLPRGFEFNTEDRPLDRPAGIP